MRRRNNPYNERESFTCEFCGENNCLPWDRKKVTVTLSEAAIRKLDGKNKSQTIEKSLSYIN